MPASDPASATQPCPWQQECARLVPTPRSRHIPVPAALALPAHRAHTRPGIFLRAVPREHPRPGCGQRPLLSGHPVCGTCGRGRERTVEGAREAQNPTCEADVQAVGGWSGGEGRQTDLTGLTV